MVQEEGRKFKDMLSCLVARAYGFNIVRMTMAESDLMVAPW